MGALHEPLFFFAGPHVFVGNSGEVEAIPEAIFQFSTVLRNYSHREFVLVE